MVLGTWITWNLAWTGMINGLVIGLFALGIVLVYRSTRIINFSVGDLGLPSAYLVPLCVVSFGWPYWPAIIATLVIGALAGTIVELAVIRRLSRAPRVIVLVATVGVAQLAQAIILALPDITAESSPQYPTALGGRYEPGLDLVVTGQQIVVLLVVPVLAIALGLLLNRTRFGRNVQASATNADLSRLSGINPKTVSTLVWAIAGFLAALSSILALGLQGSAAGIRTGLAALGAGTLVRALLAALIGGMRSFPGALAGGVAIGILESVVKFNRAGDPGLVEFLLFLAVLAAVAVLARRTEGGGESFSFAPRRPALSPRLREIWWVRNLPRGLGGLALVLAVAIPFVVTLPSRQGIYSIIMAFAITAISVTILTGWAGQLSLAQMGFAGLGAFGASSIQNGVGWPFGVALLGGALIAAAAAFILGLGALRVRGLLLSVSTLAFSIAAVSYLFRQDYLSGSGNSSGAPLNRGSIGPFDLTSKQREYFWFTLAALVLVAWLAHRIRSSGIGRSIVGVRENENAAAAMTISPTRTKLLAFTLAGFVAGLGGAVLGGAIRTLPFERFFVPADSIRLVALAVIGGLGSITGAILGALWVFGLPYFFPDNDVVPLFTSSIGLLIILLYIPGGFVSIGQYARSAINGWIERRLPPQPVKTVMRPPIALALSDRTVQTNPDGTVLSTENLLVRFGGLQAIAGVSINASPGEVVGLIGTNGAGKSTLLNAIGGFVPATGSVSLLGQEVEGFGAAHRARLGLGRTFQSATLYPELSVRETVQLALEARSRTSFVATVLPLPSGWRAERRKRAEAAELIDFLGLGRYADRYVAELSTGTRRIVELACVLGVAPKVLCLDEPTAGVAQREAEAFGPLILRIREELGATLVIVEHDMPLIMSISDRVYCLESGSVIAAGDPATVRNDPKVIDSYLGTDDRAINRSGVL